MEPIVLLKFVHVVSSAVLFGGSLGLALFMLIAAPHRDARQVAPVARMANNVAWFTLGALIVQPVTGLTLVGTLGDSFAQPWLQASYTLFGVTAILWLWAGLAQRKLARLAQACATANAPLPPEYRTLYRRWTVLAWPGFVLLVTIYWLMLAQPALWGRPQ